MTPERTKTLVECWLVGILIANAVFTALVCEWRKRRRARKLSGYSRRMKEFT